LSVNHPRVQSAHLKDVGQLIHIETQCFIEYRLSPSRFKYFIDQSAVWVIRSQNKVVAYLVLIRLITKRGLMGRIYTVAVDPEHQGNGYGKRLLRHTLKELKREGAYAVISEVKESNHPSIRLHQNVGFNTVRFLPNFYGFKKHGLKLRKTFR